MAPSRGSIPSTISLRPSAATGPCHRLTIATAPRSTDPSLGAQVLTALETLGVGFTLEIRVTAVATELSVISARQHAASFERLIYGAAPSWNVVPTEDGFSLPAGLSAVRATIYRGRRPDIAPLAVTADLAPVEPLSIITEAVQPLASDEQLLVRYLVHPARAHRRRQAWQELEDPILPSTWMTLICGLFSPARSSWNISDRRRRELATRLHQVRFEVLGLVILAGPDHTRLRERARTLTAILKARFAPSTATPLALTPWHRWNGLPPRRHLRSDSSWLLTTPAELACLWPVTSPLLAVEQSRQARLTHAQAVAPMDSLLLGTHHRRGQDLPVRLAYQDLHAGHLAIPAGATGTGKSTLLANFAHQLVRGPGRPSLLVIDPHGALARLIAARAIPEDRIEDTYLFELGDTGNPPGLPIFKQPQGVSDDAYIQVTYEAFRLLFREHWSPTRMADAIQALTATLCQQPNATLLDIEKLIADPGFRRRALARLDDPVTLQWWEHFERMPPGTQRDLIAPILTRLRQLYRSRPVRNLICRTDGVDWGQLLEEGRIILISLAGTDIEAEKDLLGELIISRLHLEFLARLTRDPNQLRRAYLMIDESHRYRGPSLPVLLSEARKVAATLLIATQFIKGWGDQLAESVLGNVGTLICFRCGPMDSALLARLLRPFSHDQLEDLDRYRCVVKMQLAGETLPAFDVRTLPLTVPANDRVLEQIRTQTRQRFAKTRGEVESALEIPPLAFQEDEYIEEE
jgi:hypothetical protein